MKVRLRQTSDHRRGTVLVLTAILMAALLVIVAFAVDLGYLMVAGTELQRTADAAALAATWELIDDESVGGQVNLSDEIVQSRLRAAEFAALNRVCSGEPDVSADAVPGADSDVAVGYLSNPADPSCEMTFTDPNKYNAVRVRVRKTADQNGEVPLFFGRVLGIESQAMEAEATAALLNNVGGFTNPPAGKKLGILPFALDVATWNALLNGGGTDAWGWDSDTGHVASGGDGIREVNLYPQGTGSPGNRGTVDIGGSNNSTADIARQIVDGISESDMAHFENSELKFDDNGELGLNGDTGISAGVKDELASIVGEPRMIPIFAEVNGPGNNAQYTIVAFVGVRVMDVKLTGSMSSKRLIIQPCSMIAWGGLPGGDTQTSHLLYSPVWLVR